MLANIRGGLDSIFVTILLGILIAAFAIWGIGANIFTGSGRVVAEVGDQSVTTEQYFNELRNEVLTLQQQVGGQFTTEQILNFSGLKQTVLRRQITRAAMSAEANTLALRASDEQVSDTLKSIEAFQIQGAFSRQLLSQYLSSTNQTESAFLKNLRSAVVQEKLFDALTVANPVPRSLAERLYIWQGETRFGSLVSITHENVGDVPAPTDEELAEYYETLKSSYATQPLRSYRYVLLTPKQFVGAVEVTEEDLEIEYGARAADFVKAELRSILQVSFQDRATADDFITRVNAGEDFVSTGAELSAFTEDEIPQGDQKQDDLVTFFGADIAAEVFTLEAGSVSPVIQSPAGFVVFKVEDITPGATTPLDDVREELTESVRTAKAIDAYYAAFNNFEDQLAELQVLDQAAEAAGLTVASVQGVDASGRNRSGIQIMTTPEELRVISGSAEFLPGDEAEFVDIDPNNSDAGVAAVVVTEEIPSEERPLEEVRTRVADQWRFEKLQEKAGKIAEQALAALQAGKTAEEVAEEFGGTSFEVKSLKRTPSEESSITPAIRRLIFELEPGQADFERAADGNGYIIAQLKEVVPGNPSARAGEVAGLHSALYANFANELLEQYEGYLLDAYPPAINNVAVEAAVQTLQ